MTIKRRKFLAGAAWGHAAAACRSRRAPTARSRRRRSAAPSASASPQAPPWFSKDPKTGQWSSGLGVSMGKAMAAALGAKIETVEVSWGNAIAALQSDKIDIMFMLDATARA